MERCVLLSWLAILCSAQNLINTINKTKNNVKVDNLPHGVEFSAISRSTLLTIIGAYQQSVHAKLEGKGLKPVYRAEFDNNKYSKDIVFPMNQERSWRHPKRMSDLPAHERIW